MSVFTGGARKSVELPFIMGVVSDLSGKPKKLEPEKETDPEKRKELERKLKAFKNLKEDFQEITSSNFDDTMKAAAPRASFVVPNRLSDDGGNLPVELEFNSLEDFKPDAVARQVPALRQLLEERERLQNLLSYLDGKENAEELLADLQKKIRELSAK